MSHQPLTEKLGNYMPPLPIVPPKNAVKKERKNPSYEYTDPQYLKKLWEAYDQNAEAVGRRIGVSGTTVASALREGQVRAVNELAAKAVYNDEFAPKPEPVVIEKPRGGGNPHRPDVRRSMAGIGGLAEKRGRFLQHDGGVNVRSMA